MSSPSGTQSSSGNEIYLDARSTLSSDDSAPAVSAPATVTINDRITETFAVEIQKLKYHNSPDGFAVIFFETHGDIRRFLAPAAIHNKFMTLPFTTKVTLRITGYRTNDRGATASTPSFSRGSLQVEHARGITIGDLAKKAVEELEKPFDDKSVVEYSWLMRWEVELPAGVKVVGNENLRT